MSRARANRVHTVALAIYSFAVRLGYAKVNPLGSLGYYQEGLKDFKYWTLDEIHRFLAWAEVNAPARFPFYQMAYETGLRVSEFQPSNGIVWIFPSPCEYFTTVVFKDQYRRGHDEKREKTYCGD